MTAFYKFVLPAIWITGFACATVVLFWAGFQEPSGKSPPAQMKWVFLAVWMAGSTFWFRFCVPLKKVAIDGSDLIVSNFSTEIRVPLRQIETISEARFRNPRTVTLRFQSPNDFGWSVFFIPKIKFIIWPWQAHPVVSELRELSGRLE